LLFLHPDADHTTTELAARLQIPLTTAHRALSRLEAAGLLVGREVGRARLLRANRHHRAFGPLAQLLLVTFGPHVVITEEFTGLPRVNTVVHRILRTRENGGQQNTTHALFPLGP
jgi:DNA-binding transcriptional ArsR family regulator